MRIEDYIMKYDLKLWRKHPDRESVVNAMDYFVKRDGVEFPDSDKFEIFTNDNGTHFVSINVTSEYFRIVHHEIVLVLSDWHERRHDFVVAPGED
jgi:hypothetical protein